MAATVTYADQSDVQSAPTMVTVAAANLVLAGRKTQLAEIVADKGYHDHGLLGDLAGRGLRTYIPEKQLPHRRWDDKPAAYQTNFRANRRRVRSAKGKRLSRWRSERGERSFAHTCETGGGRRLWVRGRPNASKLHTLRCVGYNLGLLPRKVGGQGKPRRWDCGRGGGFLRFWANLTTATAVKAAVASVRSVLNCGRRWIITATHLFQTPFIFQKRCHFLTG